jgi:hypothetical protein
MEFKEFHCLFFDNVFQVKKEKIRFLIEILFNSYLPKISNCLPKNHSQTRMIFIIIESHRIFKGQVF